MKYQLGKRRNRRPILILGILLLAAAVTFVGWRQLHDKSKKDAHPMQTSIIPASISSAVTFPVYYPDPSKLPSGYTLNKNSFSRPIKNGVAFWISYGNGKRVVFSDQAKPADSELQNFVANYIPLNIDYQTPSGLAKIGAYNNHGTIESLVSLPTNDSSWLVITAPSDINQTDLKQILRAIKH